MCLYKRARFKRTRASPDPKPGNNQPQERSNKSSFHSANRLWPENRTSTSSTERSTLLIGRSLRPFYYYYYVVVKTTTARHGDPEEEPPLRPFFFFFFFSSFLLLFSLFFYSVLTSPFPRRNTRTNLV